MYKIGLVFINPGKELTADNLITLQQFSEAIDKSTIDRFNDGILAKYKDIKVLPLKSDPRKADSDGDSYTFKNEYNDYSDSKDPTPLRCDVKISKLKNADDFVKIKDGDVTYYGGDQAWYADNPVGQSAGCGTVAAANIFAYLAKQGPSKYGKLYFGDPNNISKEDFTSHMNKVYKYVKPIEVPGANLGLGIWPMSLYTKSIADYTKNYNGLSELSYIGNEKIKYIDMSELGNITHRSKTFNTISSGLKADKPIAMLVGLNGFLPFERHWVTITEMVNDSIKGIYEAKISTWGKEQYINLNFAIDGETLYQCFVYFE